jgi:hypothetical protein
MPKYQLFLIIFEGDKIGEIFWLNTCVDVPYNTWLTSANVIPSLMCCITLPIMKVTSQFINIIIIIM